jgi:hypothetical protein
MTQVDVLLAVAAHLRKLKRELRGAKASERNWLAREIKAGERLLDEFAPKAPDAQATLSGTLTRLRTRLRRLH